MPVTHQHGIDLTNRTKEGPLFKTLKYYGLKQLNSLEYNKIFLFIKKNNWQVNDYVLWLLNNPTASGTFYDMGENVHESQEHYEER